MKLYDSRRAPNPRRVRWFMAEKDITDIEIVPVDIFKGEHKTPDYLADDLFPLVNGATKVGRRPGRLQARITRNMLY